MARSALACGSLVATGFLCVAGAVVGAQQPAPVPMPPKAEPPPQAEAPPAGRVAQQARPYPILPDAALPDASKPRCAVRIVPMDPTVDPGFRTGGLAVPGTGPTFTMRGMDGTCTTVAALPPYRVLTPSPPSTPGK
jgi:hypothetical protein